MVSIEDAARAAMDIIVSNEGSYGSINRDDNGAMSIGKLQWHGERARGLLMKIISVIPQKSEEILCEMYTELVSGADWSKRVASEAEARMLKTLLMLDEAKSIQDECAVEDIIKDIRRGMYYGLCNCGALIYFADGANQYGRYSSMWKEAALVALAGAGDVDALHNAILGIAQSRISRRERTYKKVKALDICECEVVEDGQGEKIDEACDERIIHKVVRGDTLSKISRRYGVGISDILRLNEKKYQRISRDYIEIGWELLIYEPQPKKSESEIAAEALLNAGIVEVDMITDFKHTDILIAMYRLLNLIKEGM